MAPKLHDKLEENSDLEQMSVAAWQAVIVLAWLLMLELKRDKTEKG